MRRLRAYFGHQIREIDSSRSLTLFGAFLALTHFLTAYIWASTSGLRNTLSRASLDHPPLCWPFFPNCGAIAIEPSSLNILLWGYAALAVATATLFCLRRTKPAYISLLALFVLKLFLSSLDYRQTGNYHYIAYVVTFAFLFIGAKDLVCRAVLVMSYVGASLLKFNEEWLSGSALYAKPPVSVPVLEWLCVYVIFLELVFSWLLFAQNRFLRAFVFAQLILFHLFSWHIVGYFYPLTMFSLLTIFPLVWFHDRSRAQFEAYRLGYAGKILLIAYFGAQLIPFLQKGDAALRSEGRMLALNLFDTNPVCKTQFFLKFEDRIVEIAPILSPIPRLHCDPLVVWNLARQACARNRGDRRFIDLDIAFASRRSSDQKFTPLIATENFCRRNPPYRILRGNTWFL